MGQAGTDHIENLVIVGSGPAGYTAAIYAARANLQPLLITGFQRGGIPGGQLMTTTHVENFPGFPDGVLGPDLMDLMKSQAVRWGTHLLEADADSIDLSSKPYCIEVEGQKADPPPALPGADEPWWLRLVIGHRAEHQPDSTPTNLPSQ